VNSKITRIVSRVTSRTWVGMPLCRNEEWHNVNISTTKQILLTALTLRSFPTSFQPILAKFLTSRKNIQKDAEKIHSYLMPLIKERRIHSNKNLLTCDEDILEWMTTLAEGSEQATTDLATRYVFSVIGSLYTVSAGLVDCLYDLAEKQEYINILRLEASQVLAEDNK
jgi:cytochrome P450